MLTSSKEQIGRTFLGIVEKLTFMFGEQAPKEELDVDDTRFLMTSMKFSGDVAGQLTLAVPMEITAEIAANILGLEPEDIESEEMRRDAVAEMLNVVCGHVIMELGGKGANFKLDAPVTQPMGEDSFNQMMLSDDFIGFMLDDSPVFLGLVSEN